ncbi:UDP-N-acetylmuramoylalanyl-D-glutamyl-2,6-diaminopimelate--D-alanyl-D-alanine ligase [Aurantimonas sp. Leaf443]|uniref:UDP-N-acetylmuramoylalanyl-D-glutamyl-2, 6-diaminopimelate--D-alanyl-D-alanine ligase n=1 Tax=Aurantimonas sp. Leaf443 TaxID=1736378 RepID=UPI0006FB4975|nr:UDP-N-acetylmuramoylalanyl-D-glutamyl-2,6-diaminopimelate--D-alanyl-D-alanine ligase [Aurantimonas sp. Leaf443]KQT88340.1 UDP-N-acetylmuramoylalanyl-D-glutamyl-2, 6-diaminopimelate--D-alanyl-D-alanine ligase [Aurantimonas sp. Leaf443]
MNAPLWHTQEMAAAMHGRLHGAVPDAITGLSIDSRTIQPGDAFLAILGEQFDGHDFVAAAAKGGAALHVVSKARHGEFEGLGLPLLVVDDVLRALERLAVAARARSQAGIVAVTGSVGKTTTKEALRQALAACGTVHASVASFNNHWGVPLSLARLPQEARFAVFEIGMNHPGEIRPLVKFVRPQVAIVTLIAPVHLGFFRDVEEIATAKAEIFEGLEPGGTAVLNIDDAHFVQLENLAEAAGVERVLTFGESEAAQVRLLSFESTGEGSRMVADVAGAHHEIALQTSGRHIAQNLLAVLGAVQLLGADVGAAARALGAWRAVKGRGLSTRVALAGGPLTLLDESYNANPASMKAALAVLGGTAPGSGGRRIAVLGDMRELGDHAPALHAALAEPIAAAKVDLVHLAGPDMKALASVLPAQTCRWHENAAALNASLLPTLRAGDVVMVKASNSIGFRKVVEAIEALAIGPDTHDRPSETAR